MLTVLLKLQHAWLLVNATYMEDSPRLRVRVCDSNKCPKAYVQWEPIRRSPVTYLSQVRKINAQDAHISTSWHPGVLLIVPCATLWIIALHETTMPLAPAKSIASGVCPNNDTSYEAERFVDCPVTGVTQFREDAYQRTHVQR